MSNTAIGPSSIGSNQDFQISIAAQPISTRDRNLALATIVVLAIMDAIITPFATVHLPRVDPFIPVLQTVMCVIDLLTAALLFAQYSIQPLRAIIPVAGGYVFSGLFAFIQTLAFPGAYSPTGVIGDDQRQTPVAPALNSYFRFGLASSQRRDRRWWCTMSWSHQLPNRAYVRFWH